LLGLCWVADDRRPVLVETVGQVGQVGGGGGGGEMDGKLLRSLPAFGSSVKVAATKVLT